MEEPKTLNAVKYFHKLFKHPILDSPQIPSKERSDLRVSLIAEELKELQEAIDANDIVAVADALADIQYVLSGAVLEFGLGQNFAKIFREVQRSNMSKACSSQEEVDATIKHYLEKDGTESYSVVDGDKYLIYRKSDNKTLKSINYSPADIKGILN